MSCRLKGNTVDRLIQEHAIYKQFFSDIKNRPSNMPPGDFNKYWKAKAFDAADRLEKLNNDIPYYDPAWENADAVLFPLVIDIINH